MDHRVRERRASPLTGLVPSGLPDFPIGPLHWVVAGGESGAGARPGKLEWHLALREQCQKAKVAFFEKQLGANAFYQGQRFPQKNAKGGDPAEWPEALRVREYPESPPAGRPLFEILTDLEGDRRQETGVKKQEGLADS
jgi:hypothetical protein